MKVIESGIPQFKRHLVYASHVYGGGEYGRHDSVSLTLINDAEAELVTSKKPSFNIIGKPKKIKLPSAAMKKLDDFVEKTELYKIPDKGYEEMILLDGDTDRYRLEYNDGATYVIRATLLMSDEDRDNIIAFKKYLNELSQTGKIPEVIQ